MYADDSGKIGKLMSEKINAGHIHEELSEMNSPAVEKNAMGEEEGR